MPPGKKPDVIIRTATPEDAPACGKICYDAFALINQTHGFPPDLPDVLTATGNLSMLFSRPGFHCFVAELEGRIVGSNCLDERSTISGVGPITVDPNAQNLGVGRKLMQAVIARALGRAAGIRLVQAAFHNRSLSLYVGLGFDVREPHSCMQGVTLQRSVPGCDVRVAEPADLETCNALSRQVHGFDRSAELSLAIQQNNAKVVEGSGVITAYATGLGFTAHATAQTNLDLQALIASAESIKGPGLLVPSRNTVLFRWCLSNGLRVVQPMTLMSIGLYTDPAGAWLPSIFF